MPKTARKDRKKSAFDKTLSCYILMTIDLILEFYRPKPTNCQLLFPKIRPLFSFFTRKRKKEQEIFGDILQDDVFLHRKEYKTKEKGDFYLTIRTLLSKILYQTFPTI